MLARRTTAVLAILLLTAASARAVPWSFGGGGSRGGGGGGGTVNAGTSGQVAYYPSSGAAVSGSTVGGDCAFTAPSTFICTKTNGTAFAPSATTDTTNAANITSGTIGAARMPLGLTTAPAAGAIAVGNAGGTAYANHTVSGDASLSSAGALTITKTNGTALTGAATMALPVTVANGGTQCGLPSAFSGMPASPTNGEICSVTDATACTAGTAVTTGGGSTKCQVTYNGTSWMPGGGVTSAATGGVTSVTGAGPITSSGGTTPAIGVTLPLTGNAVTLVGDTSGASNATVTTKTNGVTFAPSATTDTTNAANITSGTLGAARMPLGLIAAPAAGAIAVGNAGGTAYANHAVSGAGDLGTTTLSSAGVLNAQVANGSHITNGSIASSGLVNTGVTAGSYTSTNLTVNSEGLITAAANGSGGSSGSNPSYSTTNLTTSTTLTCPGWNRVNASGGALTEMLPPSAGMTVGAECVVQKIEAGNASPVTIAPNGTDTIVGYNGSIFLPSNEAYIVLIYGGAGRWDVVDRRNTNALRVSDFAGADPGARANACLTALGGSPGSASSIGGSCVLDQSNAASQTTITTQIVVGANNFQGQTLYVEPGQYQCEVTSTVNAGACFA
ncbi:MAG: hypothetical protein ACREQD_02720, partial [Candidatus Binataceae bacterium]